MRIMVLGAILLAASPIHAQSLDIGGVEVALGSNADGILRTLEAKFNVDSDRVLRPSGERHYSFFPRGVGGAFGSISVRDHRTESIVKFYGESDFRRAFTAALREIHQRGGENCSTRYPPIDANPAVRDVVHKYGDGTEIRIPVNFISGIETDCGAYRLMMQFPEQPRGGPGLWLELGPEQH